MDVKVDPMATVEITANGSPYKIESGISLHDFLKSLGQAPETVVVEYNRRALSHSQFETIMLHAGDSLEIVRIVAGG